MTRQRLIGAILFGAFALPTALSAQGAEPPNPLASIASLTCRFPVAAAATWKDGQPEAQVKTQQMTFSIDDIDVQDGTAELNGPGGKFFLTAVLSGASLYFVENGVGKLNITTVFAQETSPSKLKAVHARHGYIQMAVGRYVTEPTVSQNYGECDVTRMVDTAAN